MDIFHAKKNTKGNRVDFSAHRCYSFPRNQTERDSLICQREILILLEPIPIQEKEKKKVDYQHMKHKEKPKQTTKRVDKSG